MSAYPPTLELACGPVTAVDLALFAAASGDHNPLHLDESVARDAGFERPLVHGMLTMAYAGRLFTSRFGAGCVLGLQTRFTGVALRGERLLLAAEREDESDGVVTYRVRASTPDGREVATGSARIRATRA